MADEGTATCIDILLAIILPPLGVFLKFGRVLDLFVAYHFRLSPWDYLCCLCHHQAVNFNLCGGATCERHYVFCFSDLGFVYSR
nr:hydrophobic protein lti6a [Quercus suber]